MRILVVSNSLPIPPDEAGSPRPFCLARELAKSHQLHLLLCPLEKNNSSDSVSTKVRSVFKSVEILSSPPQPTALGKWSHRLTNSPSLSWEQRNPQFVLTQREVIRSAFRQLDCDAIWCDGIGAAQFLAADLPVVLDVCDSMSLICQRRAGLATSVREKFQLTWDANSYRRYEKSLAQRFPDLVFISEHDARASGAHSTTSKNTIIENGIDLDYFSSDFSLDTLASGSSEKKARKRLIFFGVLDYPPNEDAALFILQEILPRVREKDPDVELILVGKNPPSALALLAEQAEVKLHPNVPDIRPYLASAAIFLCPLRYGAGLKNKILSAIAMDIPVVATALAIEGINIQPGSDCLIGNSAEELAERIVQLLADPNLGQQLSASARKIFDRQYSWSASAEKLQELLQHAAKPRY